MNCYHISEEDQEIEDFTHCYRCKILLVQAECNNKQETNDQETEDQWRAPSVRLVAVDVEGQEKK